MPRDEIQQVMPHRCELWAWTDGEHRECFNLATEVSTIPGRLTLRVCAECKAWREADAEIENS